MILPADGVKTAKTQQQRPAYQQFRDCNADNTAAFLAFSQA